MSLLIYIKSLSPTNPYNQIVSCPETDIRGFVTTALTKSQYLLIKSRQEMSKSWVAFWVLLVLTFGFCFV